MTRHHIEILSEEQTLSAFMHWPEPATEPLPAVAIFHGLLGSKHQPHRMFVDFADRLAQAGIAALRIDFRGRGDSGGASQDITPTRDMTDARAALRYLAKNPHIAPQRIAVVGMSWGGTIALQVSARDQGIAALVLWSAAAPVSVAWTPPLHDIDGHMVAEMWGNLLGAAFFAGLDAIRPREAAQHITCPVLVVYGTEDELVSAADVSALAETLGTRDVSCEVLALEGADHVFMRHRWREAALSRTIAWLRTHL